MKGDKTPGRRIYPVGDGSLPKRERGDYFFEPKAGRWYGRVPDLRTSDVDLSDLSGHKVEEHPDGTITVSPSIGHHSWDPQWNPVYWHGYLEKGVWRED